MTIDNLVVSFRRRKIFLLVYWCKRWCSMYYAGDVFLLSYALMILTKKLPRNARIARRKYLKISSWNATQQQVHQSPSTFYRLVSRIRVWRIKIFLSSAHVKSYYVVVRWLLIQTMFERSISIRVRKLALCGFLASEIRDFWCRENVQLCKRTTFQMEQNMRRAFCL